VKGGVYLELLAEVDTICLDKTGTLTLGDPRVTQIIAYNKEQFPEKKILELAAIAEKPSEHPIGKAILKEYASNVSTSPEEWNYFPGTGIVCKIDGEEIILGNPSLLETHKIDITNYVPDSHSQQILLARSGKLIGAINIDDVLRSDAKQAIHYLKKMGLETILLTGDAKAVADHVANELGVDEVLSERLPNQKLEKVNELVGNNRVVAMIGDGINDAPALTAANVGIAMGGGTDVARECASVVLLGDDLLKVVKVLKTARQCRNIIYFNFIGTIIVDIVGILLAALGYINPLSATAIHVLSELLFICNSSRLLIGGRKWYGNKWCSPNPQKMVQTPKK